LLQEMPLGIVLTGGSRVKDQGSDQGSDRQDRVDRIGSTGCSQDPAAISRQPLIAVPRRGCRDVLAGKQFDKVRLLPGQLQ